MKLPQLCRDLQIRIERLGEGTRAAYRPLLGERQTGARKADLSREINIPYTDGEVTDWRFFNRDDINDAILRWVYDPSLSQLLLLHGQRRVGKTSFVRRLIDHGHLEEYTARPVAPVFVDFRAASLDRPDTVAELLIQKIYGRLGLPVSRPELHEDPIVWLDRKLSEVAPRLEDARLLLIVDEFDAELNRAVAAGRQPPALVGLRALMNTHPEIRWLLIVGDIYLADPVFQLVLPAVPQEVPRLAVRHLDEPYARQLVIKPAAQKEFTYDAAERGRDDIPAQIIAWTAGNPYLIHIICRKLMERAIRDRRKVISQQDLLLALHLVLDRRAYFSHFTEHLESHRPRRLIATHLAHAVPPGKRLPIESIEAELAGRAGPLRNDDVAAHVTFLEQLGVLDTTRERGGRAVGIPVQLLHQWIRNNWPYEPGNGDPGTNSINQGV
jgi:hypothetical protein